MVIFPASCGETYSSLTHISPSNSLPPFPSPPSLPPSLPLLHPFSVCPYVIKFRSRNLPVSQDIRDSLFPPPPSSTARRATVFHASSLFVISSFFVHPCRSCRQLRAMCVSFMRARAVAADFPKVLSFVTFPLTDAGIDYRIVDFAVIICRSFQPARSSYREFSRLLRNWSTVYPDLVILF